MMRTDWRRIGFGVAAHLLLLATLLIAGGCGTTKPKGSEGLAAVEIKGHTPLEIARALSEVFQEAGYQPAVLPPNKDLRLMFEKLGGTGSNLVYGDWSSKDVWYRVKIKLMTTEPETFMVICDVFRVLHRGDAHFEEETRLSALKRGSFQELLDRAKAKVESSNP